MGGIWRAISLVAGALCGAVAGGCDSIRDVVGEPVVLPANVVLQGSISELGTRRPIVLQYNGTDVCVDPLAAADAPPIPCRFYGIAGQAVSTFSFGSLPAGTPYEITVKAQPFGKICHVDNAAGVLGTTTAAPAITCENDPAVPRHAVSVAIAPEVAALAGARVRLTTEEGVWERSAFGETRLDFPDVLFDSQASLPVFKWHVTATTTVGNTVNNCNVARGTNERFNAEGQDATVPPTGPADDVEVTSCSFTVRAVVAYQAAPGQPSLPLPSSGMALALRRMRTGAIEASAAMDAFSTVTFPGVASNREALYELVITRQPEGMTCILGSAGQYQWGSAVLLLDPLDANRMPSHGWITSRNVRCRANPPLAEQLRGAFQVHTADATGATPTRHFLTFFEDGSYLYGHHATGTVCSAACGVEHGFYVHDAVAQTVSFNPVTDTNGASGLSTTSSGFASAATPLTDVRLIAGPQARIEAVFGTVTWLLIEPRAVAGQMAGAWATADHRRVWIFDPVTYNGFHAGVNGLGNAQDGCYNIENLLAQTGSYTRRGNATTCDLGEGHFTLDVPNANTVPRNPEGFVGKWPQSTSNADGRPSSPVNYSITPGAPDRLSIRETVNGSETVDGTTPVSPEIVLYRITAD